MNQIISCHNSIKSRFTVFLALHLRMLIGNIQINDWLIFSCKTIEYIDLRLYLEYADHTRKLIDINKRCTGVMILIGI